MLNLTFLIAFRRAMSSIMNYHCTVFYGNLLINNFLAQSNPLNKRVEKKEEKTSDSLHVQALISFTIIASAFLLSGPETLVHCWMDEVERVFMLAQGKPCEVQTPKCMCTFLAMCVCVCRKIKWIFIVTECSLSYLLKTVWNFKAAASFVRQVIFHFLFCRNWAFVSSFLIFLCMKYNFLFTFSLFIRPSDPIYLHS